VRVEVQQVFACSSCSPLVKAPQGCQGLLIAVVIRAHFSKRVEKSIRAQMDSASSRLKSAGTLGHVLVNDEDSSLVISFEPIREPTIWDKPLTD